VGLALNAFLFGPDLVNELLGYAYRHLTSASYVDDYLGPALASEIVKSLHLLVLGSSIAVIAVYIKPIRLNIFGHFTISRTLYWSWLFALGQLPFYVPLFYAYIFARIQPTPIPGLSDDLRIIGLAIQHTALIGRWSEARPSSFYQRFAFASLVSAFVVFLVFACLPTA
jgi:hypothetical protein